MIAKIKSNCVLEEFMGCEVDVIEIDQDGKCTIVAPDGVLEIINKDQLEFIDDDS